MTMTIANFLQAFPMFKKKHECIANREAFIDNHHYYVIVFAGRIKEVREDDVTVWTPALAEITHVSLEDFFNEICYNK